MLPLHQTDIWCQYLDLNQGPLPYQGSALNQLSYTDIMVGEDGFEPTRPKITDLQSAATLQLRRSPKMCNTLRYAFWHRHGVKGECVVKGTRKTYALYYPRILPSALSPQTSSPSPPVYFLKCFGTSFPLALYKRKPPEFFTFRGFLKLSCSQIRSRQTPARCDTSECKTSVV